MNEHQLELYNNLIKLTADNSEFFFVDHISPSDRTYRIFNYRLASYTQFLQPGAMECRGIMFEMHRHTPIRLASRPMHKFFNYHENPITMDVDLNTVDRIMVKADGSLISTYTEDNIVRLKSKGSLLSAQAIAAMNWMNKHAKLKQFCKEQTDLNRTVNMEIVGPDNRIVLGYDTTKLIVLNVRDNDTGAYIQLGPEVVDAGLMNPDVITTNNTAFIESVPDMLKSIEGFVCVTTDGLWFKVKTDRYKALHHLKDSVNSPRRLFEAVLLETTDDMKSMFYEDQMAIKLILDMEEFARNQLNDLTTKTTEFHTNNKHLDRRDYAILGLKVLTSIEFGLAMSIYLGRDIDYISVMIKNWKTYKLTE